MHNALEDFKCFFFYTKKAIIQHKKDSYCRMNTVRYRLFVFCFEYRAHVPILNIKLSFVSYSLKIQCFYPFYLC